MSSSFTPSNVVDASKEKDWPASLGMLDWDSTNIVFTKRSLIEFLKYTGTTVDPNFTNIAKLPRYAKFGKISAATDDVPTVSQLIAESTNASNVSSDYKPSRRVRTVPGGPQSDIFGQDDEGDALSVAPLKEQGQTATSAASTEATSGETLEKDSGIKFESTFKPTRRVRTTPGGPSSMANFWDPAEAEEFKPTRRVRQIPGGEDNINSIF